jgi:hypothetical protein
LFTHIGDEANDLALISAMGSATEIYPVFTIFENMEHHEIMLNFV